MVFVAKRAVRFVVTPRVVLAFTDVVDIANAVDAERVANRGEAGVESFRVEVEG